MQTPTRTIRPKQGGRPPAEPAVGGARAQDLACWHGDCHGPSAGAERVQVVMTLTFSRVGVSALPSVLCSAPSLRSGAAGWPTYRSGSGICPASVPLRSSTPANQVEGKFCFCRSSVNSRGGDYQTEVKNDAVVRPNHWNIDACTEQLGVATTCRSEIRGALVSKMGVDGSRRERMSRTDLAGTKVLRTCCPLRFATII